ncbi:hypothetical protein ES703_47195 [subsurface metagenome]
MIRTKIHLRDPNFRRLPFCTVSPGPWPDARLTDDPKQVTCGRCLRMIERRQKHEVKNT